MDLARWRWLSFAMLLAIATAAEYILPTNNTIVNEGNNGKIKLSLSESDSMVPLSEVVGLTDHARNDIPVRKTHRILRE